MNEATQPQRDTEAEKFVVENCQKAAVLLARAQSMILAAMSKNPQGNGFSPVEGSAAYTAYSLSGSRLDVLGNISALEVLRSALTRFTGEAVYVQPLPG